MTARVGIATESEAPLLDVYLNGFCTGFASALTSLRCPTDIADRESDVACAAIRADPLAREAILREIAEALSGIDSGPHDLTVRVP